MSSSQRKYFPTLYLIITAVSGILMSTFKCNTVKRFNVYFFYIFIFTAAPAQTLPFHGIVIDSVTRLPISDTNVRLYETNEYRKSNERGYFRFILRRNAQYTISLRHFAYADFEQLIKIDSLSCDTIVFPLRSRIFQSDGIIVTSTRLSTETDKTPFPVTVKSSNTLVQNNTSTISDALKDSPGLSLVRDGSWETALSIRGLSRSNIIMLVDHSRIETANDIAGALSLFNPHDLERIETIRSSGGALYGSGALGGIVHLISKQASFSETTSLSGQINSEFSSVNNFRSQHIALESSTEHFASRFSGGFQRADNTVTPAGEIPNSQFTDFSLNGSIGFTPWTSQILNLSYQRFQAENAGISGGSPIAAAAIATYRLVRRELFSFEYLIQNIYHSVPSLALRISQQNITRNVEIFQSPAITLTPHAIHSTTSGQIESKISSSGNNLIVIGADLWQRTLVSKREKVNITNNTVTGERPIPESRFFSSGFFGQDEWHMIPERATVIVGARYDWIRISNTETRNPEYVITDGTFDPSPREQIILWKSGSSLNESWSGNAGVHYSLKENISVSILASTAFRSPGLEERFQYLTLGDGVHVGNPDLQPERSIGLNAGFLWSTDNSRIRIDIFLNTLRNLVADVPGIFEGSAAFIKQNISSARLYGYEVTGEQLFSPWLALTFSLSYVRGEDTDNKSNLPQISPFHGSTGFTLRNENIGSLTLIGSASARQHNTAAGEKQTSGYAVFNIESGSIPVTISQFSIVTRGGIQNIFNTDYREHLSTIRGRVASEPGRNIFLSITVRY
jgi:hemoglobin/transferrin/lactoferrin receptor protein